jgi:hypothetical protein
LRGLGVANVDDRNEERPEYGPLAADVKLSRADVEAMEQFAVTPTDLAQRL